MNRPSIFAVFVLISALACGTPEGTPIEMSKVCDQANDGKYFQVSGVLTPRSSIYCSNRGGRMECGFDLLESAGGSNKISADVEVGSGANTMDDVPKGFKKEDLKVRDNAGNLVALGTDTVKATGKMLIAPAAPGGQGVCLMQVQKIEK
jgi:hypothetical protein